MSSAPTRGAVDQVQAGWVGQPVVARSIRIFLFLAPMIVAWLAVRLTKQNYWQPSGTIGVAIWVVQAFVVAGLSSYLAVAIGRRIMPLTAMFHMTLIFPDQAPSRLGVALRGGTIKKLAATTDLSGKSDQAAAEQAIALITQLGKHERLTRGHTERVRARAELIGAEMGLDDDELQKLRWGVLLHDVGKLEVPAHILNKESKLTNDEWATMRKHPAEGARIVEPLRPWLGDWVDAAGEHHERWDGEGYPHGLSGTEISLAGRITAVADAYDVITSKRSYKDALSAEAARQELVRCSGNQFDPAVVRAALQVGLREPKRVGLMAWLLELPVVARFAAAIPSTVAAAATATVVVAGSIGGGVVEATDVPVAIALAQPDSATRQDLPDFTPTGGRSVSSPSPAIGADSTADPGEQTDADTEGVDNSESATTTTTTVLPSTTTTISAPASTVSPIPAPSTSPARPTTTAPNPAPTTSAPSPTTPTSTTPTSTTTTTAAPTTTSTTTTTTIPSPRPTGQGFILLAGDDVPTNLSNNTLESDTTMYVIEEKQFVTLEQDLQAVSYVDGKTHKANRDEMTTIPAGTVVCSWLVRFETVKDTPERIDLESTVNFDSEILGLALTQAHLSETATLKIDGVRYSPLSTERWDSFRVTGTTAMFSFEVSQGFLDQVRVITAC